MFWKWLEDNFKYRRKCAIVFGRRRRNSVLEVSGSQKITQQQYRALLACIDYLEQREAARTDRLRSAHAPRECAMAFHQFLSLYQVQVLPQRCVDVVLGDVAGVPKRLIALDVLNLLHEEYDDTRLHFAKRYLQLMRRYTLYGYLRPTEVHAVITPYLVVPKIFRGPDLRTNMQAKSMTLLELFLLAQLLDDPSALSEQLQQACAAYRQSN